MILKMKSTSPQNSSIILTLIRVLMLSHHLGPTTCDPTTLTSNEDPSHRPTSSSSSSLLSHRNHRSHSHHHLGHHKHSHHNQIDVESSSQQLLSISQSLQPESTLQERVEDGNELLQLQATETATFLSVPLVFQESKGKLDLGVTVGDRAGGAEEDPLIGITHEKHHLWKLTLEHRENNAHDEEEGQGRSEGEGFNSTTPTLHHQDTISNQDRIQFNQNQSQSQITGSMPIGHVTPHHSHNHNNNHSFQFHLQESIPTQSRLNTTEEDSLSLSDRALSLSLPPKNNSTPARARSTTVLVASDAILVEETRQGIERSSTNANEPGDNGNGHGSSSRRVNVENDSQMENNGIVKESTSALDTSSPSSSSTTQQNTNPKVGCRSCLLNKELEATVPSATLREMRLELIKEQILRKLGLKEPPNTTYLAKEQLPLPVAQGNTLPKRHGRHSHYRARDRDIEDFYGKTEQVIIFPEDLKPRCVTHRTDPSACFTFNLPQENHVDQVSSAELWVYKLQDGKDGRNQSFWVDEVSLSPVDINHSAVRAKNIDIKQDVDVREGWMRLNLTRIVPKWLLTNNTEHALQIGCKTCLTDPSESPIDTEGDQRPFIVINYRSAPQKKRSRRNINCSPRLTECCRESFVVSFREIGWDSWIISPERYDAFYCTGSCVSINGIAHSTARHTTVMQKYIRTFGMNNKTAKIVPCCTASKMSPLSLIYRDPHNLNHTIKNEILPNMVVESCGCL